MADSIVSQKHLNTGEIRLVDFGANYGEPILIHVQLESKPEYMAISYCWGSENCLHQFRLNGQILILTSSLYSVFVELQRRGYSGRIWADAICINQDDETEKSAQIPLMQAIYRDAREVFAWLGMGRSDSLLSLEFIVQIAELVRPEESEVMPRRSFVDAITQSHLPSSGFQIWNDLTELLTSTWFDRLWTLQEAVISNHLHLGFRHITLQWVLLYRLQVTLNALNFERFWRNQGLHKAEVLDPLTRIHNIEYCRTQWRNGQLKLADLFGEARGKKASRAQDKVYALYSFMRPDFRSSVPIDLSTSTQRVFIRAAKALIYHEPEGLVPLSYAENDSKLPGLPSWVPDLDTPNPPWLLAGFCGYNAGWAQTVRAKPQISFDDGNDILALLGFSFDIVRNAVRPTLHDFDLLSADDQYPQKAQTALKWIKSCASVTREALGLCEAETLQRLSRVLVCDRPDYENNHFRKFSDLRSGKLQYVMDQLGHASDQFPWDFGRARPYYRSLVAFLRRRSFFITRAGYIGIGPDRLRAGDQIIVLYGGEAPFVVRKRQLGTCFQLLGECYLDGIMEGQAIFAHKNSKNKDQLFVFD